MTWTGDRRDLSGISAHSPAVVFGHFDADGYLAAEQTRHNLSDAGVKVVKTIVSHETSNYKFWGKSFQAFDFSNFSLAVCVDIAFSFREPELSLSYAVDVARANLGTLFVIIDHHALAKPAAPLPNLILLDVDSAYDCCLGPSSDELMLLAALCEREDVKLPKATKEGLLDRARGVRRAAADVNGVAGEKLFHLIQRRAWLFFEALGREPPEFHRNARGRRTSKSLLSPLLQAALQT